MHMCMHMYVHVCLYACMCTCIRAYVHARVCTCVCVQVYVCIHVYSVCRCPCVHVAPHCKASPRARSRPHRSAGAEPSAVGAGRDRGGASGWGVGLSAWEGPPQSAREGPPAEHLAGESRAPSERCAVTPSHRPALGAAGGRAQARVALSRPPLLRQRKRKRCFGLAWGCRRY